MALILRLGDAAKVAMENLSRIELENGTRILAIPGSEATVRGITAVDLLILDEASRIPDELVAALRPMLATRPNAKIWALSTPFGKRGWFWQRWSEENDWLKIKVTADQCPSITPEFLADERRELGEFLFQQEYLCEFIDSETAVFSSALIEAALTDDVKPIF